MADAGPPALDGRIAASVGPRAHRFTGLAVGMVVGDDRATRGFGRTGAEGRVPDGRTSFQIGSITKLFTALVLADAVQRGEVALEQPLDTLIPGAATHQDGRAITLVDLATHTAGLPRLPPGLWRRALRDRSDPYASLTTGQVLDGLSHPPRRPSGHRVRYSNYGFGVLGHALAVATGRSWGDLVQSRVTQPLGMAHTAATVDASDADIATGHSRRGRPVGDWHLPALAGAGALRSTVDDLLCFLTAFLHPDGSPLADATRCALEPRVHAGRRLQIALGWHVLDRPRGARLWVHNGGTGGFSSLVAIDPAADAGVVVLGNAARSVDRLGLDLLAARPW